MHTQRWMVRMPSRILRGLALLAAALFLAPEAARGQADACGALNAGNSYTASCQDPAYAAGIVYWNQENAVTLTVPGSATTTTITTDADNMQDSGIAVRTSAHATEARNIRLTVGGGGAVAIVQGVTSHNDDPVSTFNNTNPNNRGIVVSQQSGNGAITTVDVKSGVTIGSSTTKMKSNGLHVEVGAGQRAGAVTVTNEAKVYAMWHGVAFSNGGTAAASVTNRGDITADQHGIGVWNELTAGAVTVTNEAKIDAMWRGIAVLSSGTAAASVTNSGDITAGRSGIAIGSQFLSATPLSVTNSGDISSTSTSALHHGIVAVSFSRGVDVNAGVNTGVSVTHSGGTISVPSGGVAIRANVGLSQQEADSGHASYLAPVNTGLAKVDVKAGSVSSKWDAIEAINYEAGSVEIDISAGVTLTSTQGHGVRAELTDVGNTSGRIKITQGGTISGRKGVYAEVSRASATREMRAASAQPLIDVTWTGTFSHGTMATVAPNDSARRSADSIADAIKKARDVEAGKTIRYGSAAGIEAQAMSWSNIATEVAKGDDPGAFADAAAVTALFADGADAATKARAAAVIAAFRAALTNPDLDTIPGAAAIDTDGTTGLSDDEIETYLSMDEDNRRILLRDVLAQSLSNKEKAVFQAVVTGTGLDAALDDADAGFDNAYKTAVRALLNRYNVGNVNVAMNGGSIDSRGDGIRAYYGTPHASNGAIAVSVAEGAHVTGAEAGIYVANAGSTGMGDDRILKQTVTVNGRVTGGTGAGVHMVGGGTLTVGAAGEVRAGSSGRAIWATGRAVIRIDGEVRGGRGDGAEAVPVVHLTGGGSRLTVGAGGRVALNEEAGLAIRRDGATTVLTVIQNPDLALEDGGFTQASIDDAIERLGGTVGGEGGGEIRVAAGEPDDPDRASGVIFPVTLPEAPATALKPDSTRYGALDRAREIQLEDGEVRERDSIAIDARAPGMGDVTVTMAAGSRAVSRRSHGIRADYVASDENNGAIAVTVASGASVTGARAGIFVANAGSTGTGDARILKQTVTVHGTVTGGTDAAVHLVGGGMLTVGETGVLIAGPGQPAILVNDPGRAEIRIDGTVTGNAGAEAAVHLTGGGTLTVGPKGRIDANGADVAIWRGGATTVLTVIQDPMLALEDGRLTQASIDDAIERLGGTVDGDADGEITVAAGEPDDPNRPSGVSVEVDPVTKELSAKLVRMDCDVSSRTTDKCRLYAALPSALLAMNGLPTYGERMAAARDGNGGWARIDGAGGEWKAKNSTQRNMAFDYRRYGVQAGVDFVVGGDGRFGVSVRGLQGSAELAGSGGEIDLSGVGAGAHGTAFFGGGFYVDAQAMATWYDVELTSGGMVLKDGAKGLGLALGVEAGRPIAMGDGLTVTPGAGFSWSEVGLSFTRSMYEVSVEDARSLVGRAGLRVEMEADFRLFGSVEATREFSDERSARISGERMVSTVLSATEAEKTGFRLGVGGAHGWGDGRYALRGAAGYAARGSGNGEFDGGISLAMRF